jgi:acetate kinase
MPEKSYMYPLPYDWYANHKVRRYGFHGTSYIYTAKRASVLLDKDPEDTNLIIAHIGNGSSMCAVKNGTSYDTSMGMTPLAGLMMGTRSGDIDPAIVPYIMEKEGLSPKEMDSALNKKSGLLGITGKYIDRRDVVKGC